MAGLDNLSEMLKGVLEGIVLEIISGGEIYGYEIMRRLKSLGLDGIAEGTVYALLVRLERSRVVDIARKPSDMGPSRKFYTLNARGQEELRAFRERWDFLSDIIHNLRDHGGKQG